MGMSIWEYSKEMKCKQSTVLGCRHSCQVHDATDAVDSVKTEQSTVSHYDSDPFRARVVLLATRPSRVTSKMANTSHTLHQ